MVPTIHDLNAFQGNSFFFMQFKVFFFTTRELSNIFLYIKNEKNIVSAK